jgi:DNA-binding transcriptional MocR family regulator
MNTKSTLSVDWQAKLASRTDGLYGSMTRKLMNVLSDPEIISFGGGLPAWDLFPLDAIREVTDELLRTDGPRTLQYSTSEGFRPLRDEVTKRYRARGFDLMLDNVLIDTGSMQGIDLLGKLFLEEGDSVVLADPTFLTALQAFTLYQTRFRTVPVDEHGMRVELLPKILESHDVKFIYIMPTFQNPTGRTLSLERRHQLLQIAGRYGVPIVEDDAYGELRFDGDPLPPLKALDTQGLVIHLSSFSKTLSPGLRVGIILAPDAILEKLVFAKQIADLHTSVLPQRIVHEFLRRKWLDPHIEHIVTAYRSRRDAMLAALKQHMPSGVSWSRPEGGIFLWVTLPEGMNADVMLDEALAAKVMFVPGSNIQARASSPWERASA